MLRKKRYELLNLAYNCGCDGKYLVSLSKLKEKTGSDDVPAFLAALSADGFIDVLYTDRHGEPFVYITLTKKGLERITAKQRKAREVAVKITLAALSAVVTFVLGKLLYLLFS